MSARQFGTTAQTKPQPSSVQHIQATHTTGLDQTSSGRYGRAGSLLLQLQRHYGNRYVQQVVTCARNSRLANPRTAFVVQASLLLGPAADKYEHEADRVAQEVMSRPVSRQSIDEAAPSRPLRRSAVQCLPTGEGVAVGADVQQAIHRAGGGGQSLPDTVRAPMEHTLDADFSGVRVHTNAQADQLTRSLQAHAFTAGKDIFFRRGDYDPGSCSGQTLLAHELAHVLQQRATPGQRPQPGVIATGLRIQRYLFGEMGSVFPSLDDFKRKTEGDPTGLKQLMRPALERYVAAHPVEKNNEPKRIADMTVIELASTRQLLEDLLSGIDYLLVDMPWSSEGTEMLRIQVQGELMRVVKRQAVSGAFGALTPFAHPQVKSMAKFAPGPFIRQLRGHPVYRKWEGQGAGACVDAAEEIAAMLRTELFDADVGRVKIRGILAFPPYRMEQQANHVVTVVRLESGIKLVIDPTMGQFLGGKPMIELESDWKNTLASAAVAFKGEGYLKPVAVWYRDFSTKDAAVKFAPNPERRVITREKHESKHHSRRGHSIRKEL